MGPKTTTIYKVYRVNTDDEGGVRGRKHIGDLSVRTDKNGKIHSRSIKSALVKGNYAPANVVVDGDEDGVIFVDDEFDWPLLQLEIKSPTGASEESLETSSQENPTSGLASLSTAQKVGLGVGVIGVVGFAAWFLYSKVQAAQAAAQASALGGSPAPGVANNPPALPPVAPGVPPFVPSDVSNPIDT